MDPQEVEDILTRRLDDFAFSDTQKAGAMPGGMLSIPTDHMWSTHWNLGLFSLKVILVPCHNLV
jgi:hypothetical protein